MGTAPGAVEKPDSKSRSDSSYMKPEVLLSMSPPLPTSWSPFLPSYSLTLFGNRCTIMLITVCAGSGNGSDIEEKVSKVMLSRLHVTQLIELLDIP